MALRIGIGYDLHRLELDRPLILGGVRIPFDLGLMGHSDADVLCHAITDAILGAAALGDIGSHFPDTDPRFKDADSMDLLVRAYNLVRAQEFRIMNIDSTIICERPKLREYIDPMRQKLAEALVLPVTRVSVKAKTNEGLGPEGQGEAISVHAVVLLDRTQGSDVLGSETHI